MTKDELLKKDISRRYFVNVYTDTFGRFISTEDYESYEDAVSNKDNLSSYLETVEIVRSYSTPTPTK